MGHIWERQTLISSSIQRRHSLFLVFMLLRVENPNSHKYDVENCIKTDNAFLATEGYFSLISIQNVSIGNSACLILSPRSLDIDANSSSSHNFRLILDRIFMKGFQTNHTLLCSMMENKSLFCLPSLPSYFCWRY